MMTIGDVLRHKLTDAPDPDTRVFWSGPIQDCDLCHKPIVDNFVDGKTVYGPWGILCLKCHVKGCGGLGTGLGQLYEKQEDGRWLKVGG